MENYRLTDALRSDEQVFTPYDRYVINKFGRHINTSEGWYVCMRRGDEKIKSFINFREVRYQIIDDIPIAGPFRSYRQLSRWLEAHITFYGKNREISSYIDDNIIIPESNRLGDPLIL